jgi:hypothetical protein
MVAEGMPIGLNECRKRWFDHFITASTVSTEKTGPWTGKKMQLISAVPSKLATMPVDVAEQIPTRSFHQCKQRWLQLKTPPTTGLAKWTDLKAPC